MCKLNKLNILIENIPRKKCTTKRQGGKMKQQPTKKKFKELVGENWTCPICNVSWGCVDDGGDWVECIICTVWVHEMCSCKNICYLCNEI